MNPLDLITHWIGIKPEDLVVYAAFAAAFTIVLLLWLGLVEHDPLPARLKSLDTRRSELRSALIAGKTRRSGGLRRGMVSWTEQLSRRLKLSQGRETTSLQLKLARAGIRSREALAVCLFLRLALPLGGAAAAALLIYGFDLFQLSGGMKPVVVAAAAAAGMMAPNTYLSNRAQKRQTAIRKQLADAFDLLVICAEAGLSLDAALDRVARESASSSPELSDEIALTGLELSFLPDRQKALSGLTDRVPIPAVRALVNTLVQTERYGTPLAQALRVLAAELREERMMRAEEKAARLPAILTIPMVSFILPPLFIVLLGPAVLSTIDGLSGIKHKAPTKKVEQPHHPAKH